MTDATELDEAAVRARLEAATPGPWHEDRALGSYEYRLHDHDGYRMLSVDDTSPNQAYANAVFAAHARTDVERLLAALDEARAEVARLSGPFPCCVHCQEDPVHAVDRDEHSVECRTCGTGAEARALAAESALAAVQQVVEQAEANPSARFIHPSKIRAALALATPATPEETQP